MTEKTRQIGLVFPLAPGHQQHLFEGIAAYAQSRGNWILSAGPETFAMSIADLKGWHGDGVIAYINTNQDVKQASKLGIPVVNVSGALQKSPFPRVTNDHREIGRLAAEHLLSRGLWKFVYYGVRGVWYSEERGHGFVDRLKRDGYNATKWQGMSSVTHHAGWRDWLPEMEGWLKTIEPPLGIFVVHDNRARMLADMCRQMGLHVPHDVAIVGVNNNPLTCELGQPTLTSIDRNPRLMGYKAASLLYELISGNNPPVEDLIIPPEFLVARESTDTQAVDDPDLNMAVQFMREHYLSDISINDVLTEVMLSRRCLENRFKKHFGCSPHEFLCQIRVEHAKQMLTDSNHFFLSTIARACGFGSARHFRTVFQRIIGMKPQEYRESHQHLPPVA